MTQQTEVFLNPYDRTIRNADGSEIIDAQGMTSAEFMKQAEYTAHDYMAHGRTAIDKLFGEGYAAQHPELIAAYMQTAALDFATALLTTRLERIVAVLRKEE